MRENKPDSKRILKLIKVDPTTGVEAHISVNLTKLRNIINSRFNNEELQTLCFDLQIDYDNLGGKEKESKIREFVAYLERQGDILNLIKVISKVRPNISWEEIVEEIKLPQPSSAELWIETIARKRGRNAFLIFFLAIFVFAIWNLIIGPQLSKYWIKDEDVDWLVRSHRWITYEPLDFNPLEDSEPDIVAINEELRWIKEAGFDGVITFTSRGSFSMIPELAKQNDLMIIMGIWDPTDPQEVAQAISKQQYVDAYSVGHNGFETGRYTYTDLVKTIQYIRFHTGHAVSTTEKIGLYLSDDRFLEIGDWIFPDAHVSIKDTDSISFLADAQRDSQNIIENAILISEKANQTKPILLKMIAYPMDGITDISIEEQANFFIFILDRKRDSLSDLPNNVSISVHSAFDTPWKAEWPFYEWDSYTGLLSNQGDPRLAAEEAVRRLP